MRRTPLFRPIALVVALLGSLSAPALAVAHGHVHGHLSEQHGDEDASEHSSDQSANLEDDHEADHHGSARGIDATRASVGRSSSGEHAHGHLTLDVVPTGRELNRLAAAPLVTATVPAPVTLRATLRVVRVPARTGRNLLARPGPERGPPPTLRAPPID